MDDSHPQYGALGKVADDRLSADLDRALTDQLLARTDTGGLLMQQFEAEISLALPTSADIDRAFAPEQPAAQSHAELDSLLSLDLVGEIAVEGMKLNELLDGGATSPEQRSILKRGLLFMKRAKYNEAAEWWMLNRPSGQEKGLMGDGRFYCLCTLLLAYTYQLSGQQALAQAAASEARKARSKF